MAYVKDMVIEDSEGNKYYNGLNPTKVIKNLNDNAAITEEGYTPDALVTKTLIQNLMGIGCHNYKETDTGKTWIDGEKIYRMIISVSLKNANVACSAALPSGFDDATSVSGVIRGNGITLGVGYVGDASSGWDNAVPYSVPVVVDKNAGTLYLRPLTNRTGYTAYVILEYTKV